MVCASKIIPSQWMQVAARMARSVFRGKNNAPLGWPEATGGPTAEAACEKLYTFDDVARLVCKGADPPTGLALHFRRWARPLAESPNFPRRPVMSRREMVEALKKIYGADRRHPGRSLRPASEFSHGPEIRAF